MAELFFPQYAPRRTPADTSTVGIGNRTAQIASSIIGGAADITAGATRGALRAAEGYQNQAEQGFYMAQQSAEALLKNQEIQARERLVLQETRAGRALTSAKQAAQNEIDLYLTSPDSPSHTRPEEIPARVGEILQSHATGLYETLGEYDAVVLENAAFDFQSFGQQLIPAVRKEKTVRVRDQALGGATEFIEVQKREFFRADTPEARQRITDTMLGRMELLREQGFISAQDEEHFQVSLSKELVTESIAERRRTINLDTPQPLIAQLYADIEATSLSPSEKASQTQAVNSHLSYLLNQDAQRRNLEREARTVAEEEAMQGVLDKAFGGDWQGAIDDLNTQRQSRVIDSTTYLQRRDQLLKLQPGSGDTRRKHSDQNALMKYTEIMNLAGTSGSPVQSQADVIRVAAEYKDLLTEGHLKGGMETAYGSIDELNTEARAEEKDALSESRREIKDVEAESFRFVDAWFTETAKLPAFATFMGNAGEDSHLVVNARRDIMRYVRENPQATARDIEIYTDGLILENNKAVKKMFQARNPKLFNETIGIGINTVQGLDAELTAGRITQSQRNDLAEYLVFAQEKLSEGVAAPGTPALPSGVPAPGLPPKPPAAKSSSSQDILGNWYDAGKSWLSETYQSLTGPQKQDAEKKATESGLGAYWNKLKSLMPSPEFGPGTAPPRPPARQP
jgi:hypothetical protein